MGIEGFHPVIKPYLTPVALSEYKGKTIAVDASAWLHRGIFSCAPDLFKKNLYWELNQTDPPYVVYCMKMVTGLLDNGVIPLIVFDGASAPMKSDERAKRQAKRTQAETRAQQFLEREGIAPGNGYSKEAQLAFGQAVEVTPRMARELMRALRRERVNFLVAPYEADSQLAFLCRRQAVAAVITEDSDLVAYGCPEILFKVDRHTGRGLRFTHAAFLRGELGLIDVEDESQLFKVLQDALKFNEFTQEMVQLTAALAGCDYIDSLPSIGFRTAYKIVAEHKSVPAVIAALKKKFAPPPPKPAKQGKGKGRAPASKGKPTQEGDEPSTSTAGASADKKARAPVEVPADYQDRIERVLFTWNHAVVFDPTKAPPHAGFGNAAAPGGLVHLTELPEVMPAWPDTAFLGRAYPDDVARDVARGLRDPQPPHEMFTPLPPTTPFFTHKHKQQQQQRTQQQQHGGGGGGGAGSRGKEARTPLQRGPGAPSTAALTPKLGGIDSMLRMALARREKQKAAQEKAQEALGFVTPVGAGKEAPPLSPAKAVQFSSPNLRQQLAGGVLRSPVRKGGRAAAEGENGEAAAAGRGAGTPVLVQAWGSPARTPVTSPAARRLQLQLQDAGVPASPADIVVVQQEGPGAGRGRPGEALARGPGPAAAALHPVGAKKRAPSPAGKPPSQPPAQKKKKGGAGAAGAGARPAGQRSLSHFFGAPIRSPSKRAEAHERMAKGAAQAKKT